MATRKIMGQELFSRIQSNSNDHIKIFDLVFSSSSINYYHDKWNISQRGKRQLRRCCHGSNPD